jgi:DNA (cytosine-5)-methyltransferase 1
MMRDDWVTFRRVGNSSVIRTIRRKRGKSVRTTFALNGLANNALSRSPHSLVDVVDAAFLRIKKSPYAHVAKRRPTIRIADIFSGCGFMTLGVAEAARALGYRPRPIAAIDVNKKALEIYKRNFPSATTMVADIRGILRGRLSARLTKAERDLKDALGQIHIATAGPPCQGHSDLNNHTRRHDPKNALYFRVARFAKVIKPRHIIIENVPAVLHDKGHVVNRTRKALEKLGYIVDDGVVKLLDVGVPQTRRRHVLIASRTRTPSLEEAIERHRTLPRSVRWAIGDLRNRITADVMDTPSAQTEPMAARIQFLFKNNRHNLPNYRRPPCHRGNGHTYNSVYGRLWWGKPAQTITSGFTCMGQGRFVHPSQRRTLTPHEAARIQFIPDFFSFGDAVGTSALAEMIGNAVPPKLTFFVALELLR